MSRSYKKNPGWKASYRQGAKREKRLASKKVRRAPFVGDGSSYKKLFESWAIHDYNFRTYSRSEAVYNWGDHYGRKIYKAWIK